MHEININFKVIKIFHPSILWIFILFFLTSCATTTPKIHSPAPFQSSTRHLSDIQTWDLTGILSIRTAQTGGSLHWHWEQSHSNYTLLLSGPLGMDATKIIGNTNKVILKQSNGKEFSAKTADELFFKQTGWPLPVQHLYYWIRTLPAPNFSFKKILNSDNQVKTLIQNNWIVNYRYKINEIFPSEITLKHPQVFIHIIIQEQN